MWKTLLAASTAIAFAGMGAAQAGEKSIVLTVTNTVTPDVPYSQDPSPITPVVYVVHRGDNPIFEAGSKDRGEGLEVLAEDGSTSQLVKSLEGKEGIVEVGVLKGGLLGAGKSGTGTIAVSPGDRLSFATMLVRSNDKFFAPDGAGIRLFNDDGSLVSGNVTDQVALWDAGTEVDEVPGTGPNQPPQAHNVGPAENGAVRWITTGVEKSEDGFAYPAVAAHIQVTLQPAELMKKEMMSN